jgi:hypothetical protein
MLKKNIVHREILQCRICSMLFLLIIVVFTIYPVLDAYSHYQYLSNGVLDHDAGSVSEVDTSDYRPSGNNFYINKTNTLTSGHSASIVCSDPIHNTSNSDNPYYQFTRSIIPINGIPYTLNYPPLSSDSSPPVA